MNNKITAVQARLIAKSNGVNNVAVELNICHILQKIIKEANKGELHTYISTNELIGNDLTIQETFCELSNLGYITVSAGFDNNSKLYKVIW